MPTHPIDRLGWGWADSRAVSSLQDPACCKTRRKNGGELRGDDGALFGAQVIRYVEQFRVLFAILSIGAVHLDDRLMDFHLEEAEFSRAVIGRAKRTILVADHGKFGRQAPVKVCDLDAIDTLITDRPPPRTSPSA